MSNHRAAGLPKAGISQNRCLLFGVTVFTSAFLLFQVQPLIAKFILPWFGGTPAVWTMCMLIFQVLLFAGYAYAHLISQIRGLSRQAMLHAALLAAAAFCLPIVPDVGWKPVGDESPAVRICLLLISTVGLPYFLLSATGPLLQHWFSTACGGASPYRLYALSNIGSLLALLSYPFLFEPVFSSTMQAWLWSMLFLVFALACLLCGWTAALSCAAEKVEQRAPEAATDGNQSGSRWFLLAAIPSVMLLATTNEVCTDVAVVPFLWIIPLSLYLLSFILTFDSDRFYRRKPVALACLLGLTATVLVLTHGRTINVVLQVVIHFTNLFFVCLLCHGELVRLKPQPQFLTRFYLTLSAGGAAGGMFVGLLAPLLFRTYQELPLGIFCCLLLCVGTYLSDDERWRKICSPGRSLQVGAGLTCLLLLYFVFFAQQPAAVVALERNFYGVLTVEDHLHEITRQPVRDLVHGRVVHGLQFLDENQRRLPSTYYSFSSGIGQVLQQPHAGSRRIGIVGLGAGTLAVYGRPDDSLRFYEINPDVIRLAQSQFSFLADSPAHVETIPGDARLVLEREPDQHFDVLVLDAFSGDAIPVHLLTSEAMQIYSRHLKSDGILAIHVSNMFFDLEPVVRALGQEFGLETRMHSCEHGADGGVALGSDWMLLCRDSHRLSFLQDDVAGETGSRTVLWTDDSNNLITVLR